MILGQNNRLSTHPDNTIDDQSDHYRYKSSDKKVTTKFANQTQSHNASFTGVHGTMAYDFSHNSTNAYNPAQ